MSNVYEDLVIYTVGYNGDDRNVLTFDVDRDAPDVRERLTVEATGYVAHLKAHNIVPLRVIGAVSQHTYWSADAAI